MEGKVRLDVSDFYAIVNPRSVILITSRDGDGRPNAMAATWHTPLSFDPPLYGISVSPRRASHRMIRESGAFGVNLLPLEFAKAIHTCGRTSFSKYPDKLERAGLSVFDGPELGVPLIREAHASLEAEVVEEVEVGDHTLFVGRVASVVVSPVYTREVVLDLEKVRPALYRGRDAYLTVDPRSIVFPRVRR